MYALLRSALLLTSSFNENDFQVVSGGLLILSVLVPNLATFARRSRELMARRRGRGAAAATAAAASASGPGSGSGSAGSVRGG